MKNVYKLACKEVKKEIFPVEIIDNTHTLEFAETCVTLFNDNEMSPGTKKVIIMLPDSAQSSNPRFVGLVVTVKTDTECQIGQVIQALAANPYFKSALGKNQIEPEAFIKHFKLSLYVDSKLKIHQYNSIAEESIKNFEVQLKAMEKRFVAGKVPNLSKEEKRQLKLYFEGTSDVPKFEAIMNKIYELQQKLASHAETKPSKETIIKDLKYSQKLYMALRYKKMELEKRNEVIINSEINDNVLKPKQQLGNIFFGLHLYCFALTTKLKLNLDNFIKLAEKETQRNQSTLDMKNRQGTKAELKSLVPPEALRTISYEEHESIKLIQEAASEVFLSEGDFEELLSSNTKETSLANNLGLFSKKKKNKMPIEEKWAPSFSSSGSSSE